RCDGGDGEVAIGDRRGHVLRQGDGRNVDRVAEVGAREVNLDEVRDRVCRNRRFDFVAHDVQHAAALQASRLLFVDEVNRDLNGDDGVLADAQEVDVHREVADRIELVVLGEDLDLLAVKV